MAAGFSGGVPPAAEMSLAATTGLPAAFQDVPSFRIISGIPSLFALLPNGPIHSAAVWISLLSCQNRPEIGQTSGKARQAGKELQEKSDPEQGLCQINAALPAASFCARASGNVCRQPEPVQGLAVRFPPESVTGKHASAGTASPAGIAPNRSKARKCPVLPGISGLCVTLFRFFFSACGISFFSSLSATGSGNIPAGGT